MPTKKLLILLLAMLFITGIIRLLTRKSAPPQVISYSPNNLAYNVDLSAPIYLETNKKVSDSKITISSYPEDEYSISVDGNTVMFTHDLAFFPETRYQISVFYDKKLWHTIEFTTQTAQSNPRQLQEISKQLLIDYPLAYETPFDNGKIHVVYSDPLALEIEIIGNISQEEAIQQAKDWVVSNGLEADSHLYSIKSKQLIKEPLKVEN